MAQGATLLRRSSGPCLVILPPDKGRKTRHLAIVSHYGGGWYQAECMGEAKSCKAGTCKHIAHLGFDGGRRIRPVPRTVG